MRDSPYTAPVEEKRMSLTPCPTIASRTLQVAITSLSRSIRRFVNPEGMILQKSMTWDGTLRELRTMQ